jgi:hypothetical protein
MSPDTLRNLVYAFAIGRTLIGLAPFISAGRTAALLGFPKDHDNASARVMARLFGVRDVGLGALAAWAASDVTKLAFIMPFQAAMDIGDLVSASIPVLKKQGINRGAVMTGLFAICGAAAWLSVFAIAVVT